jgi:hypothetical protein
VTSRINVSSPDSQAAMNLADLSTGGFSVRSAEALPVGQVMRFRFFAPSGAWEVALTARSVYSRPDADGPSDAPSYQTGFRFTNDESPAVQAGIHHLLDHATAMVRFS